MLNSGASKPRVKGGLGPRAPPGSAPGALRHRLVPGTQIIRFIRIQPVLLQINSKTIKCAFIILVFWCLP